MALYPSIQIQWQDNTGNNLFVSSYSNAYCAAMTIAIALQGNGSARAVRITECGNAADGSIYYKNLYSWGKWKY